jgi:hypothetical protein
MSILEDKLRANWKPKYNTLGMPEFAIVESVEQWLNDNLTDIQERQKREVIHADDVFKILMERLHK